VLWPIWLEEEPADAPRLKALLGLAYQSQSENLQERSMRRSRKIRMRLGGGPSLLDPFPEKPRGMHRLTYYWFMNKAAAAQERSIALEVNYMHWCFPGILRC
jgi:hypothetical protein